MRSLLLGLTGLFIAHSALAAPKPRPIDLNPPPAIDCGILLSNTVPQLEHALKAVQPGKHGKPVSARVARKAVKHAGDPIAQRTTAQAYLASSTDLNTDQVVHTLHHLLPKAHVDQATLFMGWMASRLHVMSIKDFVHASDALAAMTSHHTGHLWWRQRLMNTPNLTLQYAEANRGRLDAATVGRLAALDPKNRAAIVNTFVEDKIVASGRIKLLITDFAPLFNKTSLTEFVTAFVRKHTETLRDLAAFVEVANTTGDPRNIMQEFTLALLEKNLLGQFSFDEFLQIAGVQNAVNPDLATKLINVYLASPAGNELKDLDLLKIAALTNATFLKNPRVDEALARLYEQGQSAPAVIDQASLTTPAAKVKATLLFLRGRGHATVTEIKSLIDNLKSDSAAMGEALDLMMANVNSQNVATFTPIDLEQIAGVPGMKMDRLLSGPISQTIQSWPVGARLEWLINSILKKSDPAGYQGALVNLVVDANVVAQDKLTMPQMQQVLLELSSRAAKYQSSLKFMDGNYAIAGELYSVFTESVRAEMISDILAEFAQKLSPQQFAQLMHPLPEDSDEARRFIAEYLKVHPSFLPAEMTETADRTWPVVLSEGAAPQPMTSAQMHTMLGEHYSPENEDTQAPFMRLVSLQTEEESARHLLVVYETLLDAFLFEDPAIQDQQLKAEFEEDLSDREDVDDAVTFIEDVQSEEVRKEMIEAFTDEHSVDTDEIVKFAELLTDPSLKSEMVKQILLSWIEDSDSDVDASTFDGLKELMLSEDLFETLKALTERQVENENLNDASTLTETLDLLDDEDQKLDLTLLAANAAGRNWTSSEVDDVAEHFGVESRKHLIEAIIASDIDNEDDISSRVNSDLFPKTADLMSAIEFVIDHAREGGHKIALHPHGYQLLENVEDDLVHDRLLAKLVKESIDNIDEDDDLDTVLENAKSDKGKGLVLLAFVEAKTYKMSESRLRALLDDITDQGTKRKIRAVHFQKGK